MVGPVALAVIAAVALLWVVSRLADPTPELLVVAGLAAFLLAGSYVLASYVMWVLPLVAWRHRAGISRVLLVWSFLVLLAYQAARGHAAATIDDSRRLARIVRRDRDVAVVGARGLSVAAIRRLRAATGRGANPEVPRLTRHERTLAGCGCRSQRRGARASASPASTGSAITPDGVHELASARACRCWSSPARARARRSPTTTYAAAGARRS